MPVSCRCCPGWADIRAGLPAATLALLVLGGCAAPKPAPVIDRLPQVPAAKPAAKPPAAAAVKPGVPQADQPRAETYTVRAGDTLFSISLEFGFDYREVAAWNNLNDPSRIFVGQVLRMTPPRAVATAPLRSPGGSIDSQALDAAGKPPASASGARGEPRGLRVPYSDQAFAQMSGLKPEPASVAKADAKPEPKPPAAEAKAIPPGDEVDWMWPTTGKLIATFNDSTSKGIGIAGKAGQPVLAAGPGLVIFSGTGIRGLGRLIVIKHNERFLSVYAHNRELLVKEGQNVTRGQRIAEMGDSDTDQVKLHFEIRRLGRPVDPISLLPPG
ncbi:MAG: peptidoglycan DD-metalloendopeptidase family protein [Betaproteobacteria bacterium]|jgi:lipoprotein NlpD|nr:peptidoglycan DD-metalloendopeptidase family protein [Betaproteobacteria bacterium]